MSPDRAPAGPFRTKAGTFVRRALSFRERAQGAVVPPLTRSGRPVRVGFRVWFERARGAVPGSIQLTPLAAPAASLEPSDGLVPREPQGGFPVAPAGPLIVFPAEFGR